MPEIRLGGLPNMADIQLGSIQIRRSPSRRRACLEE